MRDQLPAMICRSYNNNIGMGFRIGNPDAAITVGAFLDLTCSKSKKLFLTLLTKVCISFYLCLNKLANPWIVVLSQQVLLQMEQSHKGQVAVVIHPFLTPWRANSLIGKIRCVAHDEFLLLG